MACVDRNHVQPKMITKVGLNFLELIFTQNSIVDEYTRESITDSPMHQYCGYRRIYSSRQRANGMSFPDRAFDGGDGFLYKPLRRPASFRIANIEDKVAQQVRAEFGVVHFRMELHGPSPALGILNRCQRVGAPRHYPEP